MAFVGGSQHTLRRYLLGTASGAALIGGAPLAHAADSMPPIDHFYVDFTGQYSLQGGHTEWANSQIFSGGGQPRIKVRNGIDTYLDMALQSGDWYLTLSANYGRTGNSHDAFNYKKYDNFFSRYSHHRGQATHHESHTIIDFTLGKDVGLGCIGLDGSSIISAGVRYEHFVARTNTSFIYSGHGYTKFGSPAYYSYYTFARKIDRQFVGWGPVVTWKSRMPIDPDWSLAWGVNAAFIVGDRSVELDGSKVLQKT